MRELHPGVEDPDELLQTLVASVGEALAESEPPRPQADDIPGGPTAFSVGHIHLLASPRAREELQLTLWPRVRNWLHEPAALVTGSYAGPRQVAERVMQANISPAVIGEAASLTTGPVRRDLPPLASGMLPETKSRGRSRTGLKPARVPRARGLPFRLGDETVAMLHARLEAGFLLAACEALWPSRASALEWVLRNDAGLVDWDGLIARQQGLLAPMAPVVRRMLAGTTASLDEARFGPLLAIARVSPGAETSAVGGTTRDVTGPLLAERLLRLEYAEAYGAGRHVVWEEDGRVFVDLWEPERHLELVRQRDGDVGVARLVKRVLARRME